MIDIEALEYGRVKEAISSLCPNSGTVDQSTTPKFPYLQFVQMDNPTYKPTQDSDSKENHVQPMIQIDVYSTASLYNAKQILKLADTQMQSDGWERTFMQPLNLSSPYRYTARYRAVVEEISPNNFRVFSN